MRAPTAADDTATLVHYCARQDGKGGWPEWRDGAWYAPDDDEPIPEDALRDECLAVIISWLIEDAPLPVVLTETPNGNPIYAYVINDVEIYDPTISSCGRFRVAPTVHGLSLSDAAYLADLNVRQYGPNYLD